MSFDIVRGDTWPPMDISIATDVSSADSVEFRWRKPDGTEYLSNLTIVDLEDGTFMMEWSSGDTDQIGPHHAEIVVTTSGAIQTFPADGSKIIWWVNPQIADL